jgi:hypothetical protein
MYAAMEIAAGGNSTRARPPSSRASSRPVFRSRKFQRQRRYRAAPRLPPPGGATGLAKCRARARERAWASPLGPATLPGRTGARLRKFGQGGRRGSLLRNGSPAPPHVPVARMQARLPPLLPLLPGQSVLLPILLPSRSPRERSTRSSEVREKRRRPRAETKACPRGLRKETQLLSAGSDFKPLRSADKTGLCARPGSRSRPNPARGERTC